MCYDGIFAAQDGRRCRAVRGPVLFVVVVCLGAGSCTREVVRWRAGVQRKQGQAGRDAKGVRGATAAVGGARRLEMLQPAGDGSVAHSDVSSWMRCGEAARVWHDWHAGMCVDGRVCRRHALLLLLRVKHNGPLKM